ncbi:MAG TPA: ABC transporter permease [Candidatus Thermoplasmatota archaeon]
MTGRPYDAARPFEAFARAPGGGRLERGRVGMFLGAWKARAYIRILGGNREPSWVFFDTVLPLLAIMAYLYVYRYFGAPDEFVAFVVLGGAMVAFWLSVLWGIANHMYWEKQTGNLELYFISPVPPEALMFGMATGSLVNSGTRAAAAVAAGVLVFGAAFDPRGVPAAAGVLLLTLASLYLLGMMFASIFLVYGREGEHLAQSLQEPVFFAAGFYYPVRTLPTGVQVVASVLPLTVGLDAMRQLLIEGLEGLMPLEWEVALLFGMLAFFAVGARGSMRFMERLAKREGRLTLRWQ